MTNPGLVGFPGPAAADIPIIPPGAVVSLTASESAWYAANRMTSMRFSVQVRTRPLVGATLDCGTASGNIEVAIYSVTRAGLNAFNLSKVGGSGSIPCPTPGTSPMAASSIWVPFASMAALDLGQYAVGLWCDNTTATFAHTIANAIGRAGVSLTDGGSAISGGAPVSVRGATYQGRTFACVLETG